MLFVCACMCDWMKGKSNNCRFIQFFKPFPSTIMRVDSTQECQPHSQNKHWVPEVFQGCHSG